MTQTEFEALPKEKQAEIFANAMRVQMPMAVFTQEEINTIKFCVSKMLEVNKLQHGEMCANILTGAYDRTEEFERVLTKLSTLK